jgi:hypothetical protein
MGRKQDPIFRVVDFFETEPIAVVHSALSLVKRIVQKREAADVAVPKKKVVRRKKKLAPVVPAAPKPDAADIALGATAPMSPAPATAPEPVRVPRRRKSAATVTTAPTTAGAGEPLPGMPGLGPATVG